MPTVDRRWRHRFQVVRHTAESTEPLSSHRSVVAALLWACLRDRWRGESAVWHRVRATPQPAQADQ